MIKRKGLTASLVALLVLAVLVPGAAMAATVVTPRIAKRIAARQARMAEKFQKRQEITAAKDERLASDIEAMGKAADAVEAAGGDVAAARDLLARAAKAAADAEAADAEALAALKAGGSKKDEITRLHGAGKQAGEGRREARKLIRMARRSLRTEARGHGLRPQDVFPKNGGGDHKD